MSRLHGPSHRALQDEFDSRRLADSIEAIAAKPELDEMATAFVASRDTIDEWMGRVVSGADDV